MSPRPAALALLLATLVLAGLWLAGRTGGPEPLKAEYKTLDPIRFVAAFEDQQARHGGKDGVVRPPTGDVYLRFRRWEIVPALELKAGVAYRLHMMSDDVAHSAALGEAELMVEPETEVTVPFIAAASGRVRLQCGEYCGLSHTKMIGQLDVVP